MDIKEWNVHPTMAPTAAALRDDPFKYTPWVFDMPSGKAHSYQQQVVEKEVQLKLQGFKDKVSSAFRDELASEICGDPAKPRFKWDATRESLEEMSASKPATVQPLRTLIQEPGKKVVQTAVGERLMLRAPAAGMKDLLCMEELQEAAAQCSGLRGRHGSWEYKSLYITAMVLGNNEPNIVVVLDRVAQAVEALPRDERNEQDEALACLSLFMAVQGAASVDTACKATQFTCTANAAFVKLAAFADEACTLSAMLKFSFLLEKAIALQRPKRTNTLEMLSKSITSAMAEGATHMLVARGKAYHLSKIGGDKNVILFTTCKSDGGEVTSIGASLQNSIMSMDCITSSSEGEDWGRLGFIGRTFVRVNRRQGLSSRTSLVRTHQAVVSRTHVQNDCDVYDVWVHDYVVQRLDQVQVCHQAAMASVCEDEEKSICLPEQGMRANNMRDGEETSWLSEQSMRANNMRDDDVNQWLASASMPATYAEGLLPLSSKMGSRPAYLPHMVAAFDMLRQRRAYFNSLSHFTAATNPWMSDRLRALPDLHIALYNSNSWRHERLLGGAMAIGYQHRGNNPHMRAGMHQPASNTHTGLSVKGFDWWLRTHCQGSLRHLGVGASLAMVEYARPAQAPVQANPLPAHPCSTLSGLQSHVISLAPGDWCEDLTSETCDCYSTHIASRRTSMDSDTNSSLTQLTSSSDSEPEKVGGGTGTRELRMDASHNSQSMHGRQAGRLHSQSGAARVRRTGTVKVHRSGGATLLESHSIPVRASNQCSSNGAVKAPKEHTAQEVDEPSAFKKVVNQHKKGFGGRLLSMAAMPFKLVGCAIGTAVHAAHQPSAACAQPVGNSNAPDSMQGSNHAACSVRACSGVTA